VTFGHRVPCSHHSQHFACARAVSCTRIDESPQGSGYRSRTLASPLSSFLHRPPSVDVGWFFPFSGPRGPHFTRNPTHASSESHGLRLSPGLRHATHQQGQRWGKAPLGEYCTQYAHYQTLPTFFHGPHPRLHGYPRPQGYTRPRTHLQTTHVYRLPHARTHPPGTAQHHALHGMVLAHATTTLLSRHSSCHAHRATYIPVTASAKAMPRTKSVFHVLILSFLTLPHVNHNAVHKLFGKPSPCLLKPANCTLHES
jgi:hypothetical protein